MLYKPYLSQTFSDLCVCVFVCKCVCVCVGLCSFRVTYLVAITHSLWWDRLGSFERMQQCISLWWLGALKAASEVLLLLWLLFGFVVKLCYVSYVKLCSPVCPCAQDLEIASCWVVCDSGVDSGIILTWVWV